MLGSLPHGNAFSLLMGKFLCYSGRLAPGVSPSNRFSLAEKEKGALSSSHQRFSGLCYALRFSCCLAPGASPSSRFSLAEKAKDALSSSPQRFSGLCCAFRFSCCLAPGANSSGHKSVRLLRQRAPLRRPVLCLSDLCGALRFS